MVMPYCGNTTDVKDITFKNDDGSTFTGEYVKSEYKNIDEIKSYLATFASSSLFKTDLKLSDINNPKQYDDYYEIDGNLYCRNYSGKGWKSNYTGNYNIEITSSSDNKYLVNISYEYLNDDSKCELKDLSKCSNNNFKYDFPYYIVVAFLVLIFVILQHLSFAIHQEHEHRFLELLRHLRVLALLKSYELIHLLQVKLMHEYV